MLKKTHVESYTVLETTANATVAWPNENIILNANRSALSLLLS